jgi:cyclic beta-1,2-glucan synthetase
MYRAWVEEVLGLQVRDGRLRIDPVIPAAWEGFGLTYRHGEAVYQIEVENPEGWERGVAWIELDGRRMDEAVIPLERELVKHRVRVRLGPPA